MRRLSPIVLIALLASGCAGLDLDGFSDESTPAEATLAPVIALEPVASIPPPPPGPVESPPQPALDPRVTPPLPPLPGAEPVASDPIVDEAVATASAPPNTIVLPTPRAKQATPGRVVAKIGNEVVTIPELTDAVKARLALMPADRPPTRRQIISLARTVLEGLIERSLVVQEAEIRFPTPEALDQIERQIRKRWDEQDLPILILRERVTDASALEARLSRRGLSVETLRERHRVRELGLELARRDPQANSTQRTDLTAYLDLLRKRYPITSVLTPAEIAAAAGDPKASGE